MSLKLRAHEIKQIKALSLGYGHTARMNHDGCSAGTDTRRRLYVTKQPTGNILCYCHNCSEGTSIGGGGPRVRAAPAAVAGAAAVTAYTPTIGIPLTDFGKLWLTAWGVPPTGAWMSTVDDDGIIFPFPDGEQIRWFSNDPMRWETRGDVEYAVDGTDIIYAEDIISTLKWLESCPTNGGICLFGTNPGKAAPPVMRGTDMHMVWLDNDNPKVLENAELVARKLAAFSGNVVLCQGGTDPKRYTKKELNDVRDQARKLCGAAAPVDKPYHVLQVPIPHQRVRAGLGV